MWYLYPLVVIAGIAAAIQPGQNATLGRSLEQPLFAGIVSFATSLLVFVAIMAATGRLSLPSATQLAEAPWWAWFSGVLGCGVILTQIFIAEKVGAAVHLSLVVTAGACTSILLDHYGLAGFDPHPASVWRLLGGALMVAGVILVAAF